MEAKRKAEEQERLRQEEEDRNAAVALQVFLVHFRRIKHFFK